MSKNSFTDEYLSARRAQVSAGASFQLAEQAGRERLNSSPAQKLPAIQNVEPRRTLPETGPIVNPTMSARSRGLVSGTTQQTPAPTASSNPRARGLSFMPGAYVTSDEAPKNGFQRFNLAVSSIGQTLPAAVAVGVDTVGQYLKNDAASAGTRKNDPLYQANRAEYLRIYNSLPGLRSQYGTDSDQYRQAQARLDELRAGMNGQMTKDAVSMDSTGMKLMTGAIETREKALEGMTGAPRWLAEQGISIGQNLAMLPTAAINPALPLAGMGAIAAGDKMYELNAQGKAPEEALGRGLLAGGIEAATEKIPLDTLMDMVKTGGRSALKNLLKQAGVEAGEESLSYVMNYIADKAARDPNASFSMAELANSAAGGAFSGLVLGGLGTAANRFQSLPMFDQRRVETFPEVQRPTVEPLPDVSGPAVPSAAQDGANVQSGTVDTPAPQQTRKNASTGEAAAYRAVKPENVELPTVPIINLSMQTVADRNGGVLPETGNALRKDAIARARTRLGLDQKSAAYIPASNVMRNGEEYVLKITRASLNKMLSPADGNRVPTESIAVLDNLERIASNGVWFDSQGDRKNRTQINGIDHLKRQSILTVPLTK